MLLNDNFDFLSYLLFDHLFYVILVLGVRLSKGVWWFLHLLHSLAVNTLNHQAVNRLVERINLRYGFGFIYMMGLVLCHGVYRRIAPLTFTFLIHNFKIVSIFLDHFQP